MSIFSPSVFRQSVFRNDSAFGINFDGATLDWSTFSSNLPKGAAFTRASTGIYTSTNGLLTSASTDILRINNQVTTTRTNLVRNGSASGGSSGIAPTNWRGALTFNGIALTPLYPQTIGSVMGYVYRLSGTSTAGGGFNLNFETNNGISSSSGQQYSISCYAAVLAGDATKTTILSLRLQGTDGTNQTEFPASTNFKDLLSSTPLRLTTTATLSSGSTTNSRPVIEVNWASSGMVIDCTLFFGNIQQELNSIATQFISTTGSAVTVNDTQPIGMLLESPSTNLITYSNDLTNVAWSKVNTSVSNSSMAGPYGTTSISTLTDNTTSGPHTVVFGNSFTLNSVYTFSTYLKKGTNRYAQIRCDASIGAQYQNVDLQTGVLGSSSGMTSSITLAANGFYRIVCTFKASSTTTANVGVGLIQSNTSTRDLAYVGTGTTINISLVQLEVDSVASSGIPTSGATTTRALDLYKIANLENIGFNQNQGTIYVEGIIYYPSSTTIPIFSICDSTVNNRYQVLFDALSSSFLSRVVSGGTAANPGTVTGYTLGTPFKVAMTYSIGSATTCANGTLGTSSAPTSLPTQATLTDGLRIGCQPTGSGFGPTVHQIYIKRFMYIPSKLTNSQLQFLTS